MPDSNRPGSDSPDLDALDAELAGKEAAEAPEPAPGAPEAAPAELLDEAALKVFLAMPFDYLAARKGAHWKLSPEELAALSPIAVRVANKYAPAILAKWSDEIGLAAVLGVIIFKRVNLDKQTETAEEKTDPAA